jgi:hypothetical protein
MSIEDKTYLINKFKKFTKFANNFHGFTKIGTYSPHVNESQDMEETIVHIRNNV